MLMYCLYMILTALMACGLYSLRLRDISGSRAAGAFITAGVGALLGFVCSKLGYAVLLLRFNRLTDMDPRYFSMFAGAAGVVLAVVLCSGLCRVKASDALNAFAPAGALLLCGARLGEYILGATGSYGRLGMSDYLEGLMPDTWYICLAEAGVALIAVLLAWFVYDRRVCFLRTAWWIMSWQLITELMHNQFMMISFVREEQVLCAICLAVIMFLHCRRGLSHDDTYRFTPFFWFFAPVACITYLEFELDKSPIDKMLGNWALAAQEAAGNDQGFICQLYYFSNDHHELLCFGAILLCVLWILLLERCALKRRADLKRNPW